MPGLDTNLALLYQTEDGQPRDPRVIVESEDHPDRLLLETKICKEDGFQKQQGKSYAAAIYGADRLTRKIETLIVWTEPSNGIDMALSFQEAEGCALIWYAANPYFIYHCVSLTAAPRQEIRQ